MFAVRFGLRIFIDPPGAVHIYIYIYIYTLQVIQVNHFHLCIIQSTTLIQLKRPTITLSKWKSQEKKSPELEDASTEEGHNITLVAEVEKKKPEP